MTGNIGHARGFPPTLEHIDETGIECCSPGAKDLGGFGIDIIWEVVGLVVLSLKLDLDYKGSKLKEILSLIKTKSK